MVKYILGIELKETKGGFFVRILKRAVILILILALTLSLLACTAEGGGEEIKAKNESIYGYFDTVSTIYDYTGSSDEDFSALVDRIEGELSRYHKLYDIYNSYEGITNIKDINDKAGEGPVKVSEEIIDLFLFARDMYNRTDGYVNIAMGSVLSLWHEYREEGVSTPPADKLLRASMHTDISDIIINEYNSTVEICDPEISIDVGAVAKGYATEKIAEMLLSEGKSGYVLDIGGNLRIVGQKPSGKAFRVGIRNPEKGSSAYATTLDVYTGSVVTSGIYERYYTVDGIDYHHIIDKNTFFPSTKYKSVSVITESSALADALSTAFFCMQEEDISAVIEEYMEEIKVIVVTPEGKIKTIEKE